MLTPQEQVDTIKEVLNGLEEPERQLVLRCQGEIIEVVKKYQEAGLLALSIVGAEYALQAEQEGW